MLTLKQVSSFKDLADFIHFSSMQGLRFYWQKQETDFVYTYDKMPSGVMSRYYGSDIDMVCPGAWAFRSRIWPVFSFKQALDSPLFSSYDFEQVSLNFWKSCGVSDFLCVLSGQPGLNSFSFFAFDKIIDNPVDVSLPYIALTRKMDVWLNEHIDLKPYSREFSGLSSSEKDVVRLQVNDPSLSQKEKALMLNISVQTLRAKEKRIAEKFGVTSFSSAILLVERSREFDWS